MGSNLKDPGEIDTLLAVQDVKRDRSVDKSSHDQTEIPNNFNTKYSHLTRSKIYRFWKSTAERKKLEMVTEIPTFFVREQ